MVFNAFIEMTEKSFEIKLFYVSLMCYIFKVWQAILKTLAGRIWPLGHSLPIYGQVQ